MQSPDTIVLRSVEEARDEILRYFQPGPAERVPLLQALGRVTAAPIAADISVPPFANSAMDGYAVLGADVQSATPDAPVTLRIVAEVPAGGMTDLPVTPGTAIRIMTGAPMPPQADTVVPFEETDEGQADALHAAGLVRIFKRVPTGASVRAAGEDVQAGAVVVPTGTLVRAAEIGVLATVGAAQVAVYRRPKVAILATGDELVDVGERPGPGQIRNANGYSNAAQVLAAGGEPLQLPIARDTERELMARLDEGLQWGAELFLTSGGVSVGDYDVVKKVLMQRGQMEFWRVKMKPGKPVAFGVIDGVPLLGLPGNPVSAMVGFELFGRPALLKMQGRTGWSRPTLEATFTGTLSDRADRRQYVRVRVQQRDGIWLAHLTGEQGSGVLTSMMYADGLMIVPEGMTLVEPGTRLPVMMLNWPEVAPDQSFGAADAGADCC
ncbi:MAG: molybdopterin molybdotransferase MoeA [Chloroflexota bacterium]|nr:molybdopterin molybdotransferase MoeA [Chloroflexota bacterium]PLS79027.1 MAG: molybdopterin molybdenumtransferase MoeA [Chloroflexota bacterium]